MITVLVEDDLFTFYDIYEKLDKLNIFNSNYQNEMLNRLSDIQDKLEEINNWEVDHKHRYGLITNTTNVVLICFSILTD